MTDLITAEEAEKLLDGTLPTELANEHRALLLQAIGTDDAGAMAYSQDGKPIRRVGEITSPAKRAAEAISNLARTVIALHAQLAAVENRAKEAEDRNAYWADKAEAAEAAQAAVVEQAALVAGRSLNVGEAAMRIRALAPASGVETLAALRAERDAAREALMKAGIAMHVSKRETAEAIAERDTLAARLAASEGQVKVLREALTELARHPEDHGELMPSDFRDYYRDTCNFAAAALATQEAGT